MSDESPASETPKPDAEETAENSDPEGVGENDAPEDPEINAILADLDDDEDPDDLPKQKSTRTQKAKAILREYAQMSSTHGVNHIGEAHTYRVIFIWAFFLLLCLAAFAYLFSSIIIKYLKYEVQVEIKMKNEARTFPAVTICNLNPYKKSKLMEIPELAALVRAFEVAVG